MFRHFEQQARFTSFLFVGFSLRDPTFTCSGTKHG